MVPSEVNVSPAPPPSRPRAVVARRWLRLSWLALAWERLSLAFWPLACVGGGTVALAWSGQTAALPAWGHWGVLGVCGGAMLVTGWRGACRLRWPTRREAWRRLEEGDPHRVLSAATDRLAFATDDPLSRALWLRHRRRARRAAAALRPRPPDPVVAARDPHALRFIPIMLLVVTAAGAPDPLTRLLAFVTPPLNWGEGMPVARVWITPPAYTALPPLSLDSSRPGTGDPTLKVPEGSAVLVLVHGRATEGRLGVGPVEEALEALDPRALRGTAVVEGEGRLSVRVDGHTLLERPLTVLADDPPEVAFATPPSADPRGRLGVSLRARDDHGVVGLGVTGMPVMPRRSDPDTPLAIDIPPPQATDTGIAAHTRVDLTAHRWAGREVRLTPWATDALGQRTPGASVVVTLPRRPFRHPVARALVAERERLSDDPTALPGVVTRLDGITARPESFRGSSSVYLALRIARSHLASFGRGADLERVRDLLWEAAVRIEDGEGARVSADLDDLRDHLREALTGPLSQAELERLVAEARRTLGRLIEETRRTLQTLDPEGLLSQAMDVEQGIVDLEQMLADLQDMSRLGAADAARALLERLSQALDGLDEGISAETVASLRAQAEIFAALTRLRRDQESLLDETFRHDQTLGERIDPPGTQTPETQAGDFLPLPEREPLRRTPPVLDAAPDHPVSAAVAEDLSERQKALGRRLETILGTIAEQTDRVPPPLAEAALAMEAAASRLGAGTLSPAMEEQRRALDRLSSGEQTMQNQLRQGLRSGLPLLPQGGGAGLDPLGRDAEGPGSGNDRLGVPDRSEARRAREILEELRRRANDPTRTPPEKAYIDRLMPHF